MIPIDRAATHVSFIFCSVHLVVAILIYAHSGVNESHHYSYYDMVDYYRVSFISGHVDLQFPPHFV